MSLSLQLKRHDRFSNFHVIVRKKLAFVLKLRSSGLSLWMLPRSPEISELQTWAQCNNLGNMVTKYTDIHPQQPPLCILPVRGENAQKSTERSTVEVQVSGCLCKWPFLLLPPSTQVIYHQHILGALSLSDCTAY